MKKILLSLFSIALITSVFAQDSYKKRPTIGINFFVSDFQMAKDIRKNGLSYLIDKRQILLGKNLNPGLAISYMQGISTHVDFLATLGGSFVRYPFENQAVPFNTNFLLEATAGMNLKLLSDKYWVVPFMHLGLGASKYTVTYAAFAPVGFGFQVALSEDAFILLSSDYRIPVTEGAAYHFYHSIGFAGNITQKKKSQQVLR